MDGLNFLAMGVTSENVASQFGITRKEQDEFAANSFAKALAAQRSGKFKEEIVPVKATWSDPKTGDQKEILVTEDDGIRLVIRLSAASAQRLRLVIPKSKH